MIDNSDTPETIVVDPRVFVRGPFITCPKCGQESFGVVSISGNSYSRRCRSCLDPAVSFRLPEVRKRVIYLDQNVLSDMAKATNPSLRSYESAKAQGWGEVHDAVVRAINFQLAICPSSVIHHLESSVAPFPDALEDLYVRLSHGLTFHDPMHIWATQVGRHVPLWLDGRGDELPTLDQQDALKGTPHGWNDQLIITAKLPVTEEDLDRFRAYRGTTSDRLNAFYAEWRANQDKPVEYWFQREAESFVRPWLEQFRRHIERKQMFEKIRAVSQGWSARRDRSAGEVLEEIGRLSAPWVVSDPSPLDRGTRSITDAIEWQLQRHGVPDNQRDAKTVEYLNYLISKGTLPFIEIGAGLFATLARKSSGGAKVPNRGTVNDFMTIMTLLPYCDAMYVDRACHGFIDEIRSQGLVPYPTKIFSARARSDFLEYLHSLEGEANPEHWKTLGDVYGLSHTEESCVASTDPSGAS